MVSLASPGFQLKSCCPTYATVFLSSARLSFTLAGFKPSANSSKQRSEALCGLEVRAEGALSSNQPTLQAEQMGSLQDDESNAPNAMFTPYQMGPFHLSHRVVMAPLTRSRAMYGVPQPNAAIYYGQRATSGGFIISEATGVNLTSFGYRHTPGIYSEEQVEAWKPVVKAVHDKGGIFFCQIWHVGRLSHSAYQPNGEAPISSVAKAYPGKMLLPNEYGDEIVPYPTPRALTTDEIPAIIADFRIAARNSIKAGFDGVEIHGAHGYLIDQFLKDGFNTRTDRYGGSMENNCRFALEIVKAVIDEVGADRVGIRLSLHDFMVDMVVSDREALGTYLSQELSKLNVLYAHFVEPRITAGQVSIETDHNLAPFRKVFKGTFLVAGGYTRDDGINAIKTGYADLVVYGRPFISNPDLPKRLALNAPLTPYDRASFYIQDQVKGYIDYPFMEEHKE